MILFRSVQKKMGVRGKLNKTFLKFLVKYLAYLMIFQTLLKIIKLFNMPFSQNFSYLIPGISYHTDFELVPEPCCKGSNQMYSPIYYVVSLSNIILIQIFYNTVRGGRKNVYITIILLGLI